MHEYTHSIVHTKVQWRRNVALPGNLRARDKHGWRRYEFSLSSPFFLLTKISQSAQKNIPPCANVHWSKVETITFQRPFSLMVELFDIVSSGNISFLLSFFLFV